HRQRNSQILCVLRGEIGLEHGAARELSPGQQQRLDDQLRGSASRIKVAQDPIHAWLGKNSVEVKCAIRSQLRMIMAKVLKVLADNEQVVELLVHRLKVGDRLSRLGIEHGEGELQVLSRLWR